MHTATGKKAFGPNNPGFAINHKQPQGFNLVEILVLMVIIGSYTAILIPALTKARRQSRSLVNMSNQRQIVATLNCFASDNDGKYPESVATIGLLNEHWNWQEPTMMTSCRSRSPQLRRSLSAYLYTYIGNSTVMFCPNAPKQYRHLQQSWDAGDNWDNPETPQAQDPVVGTYCFYWNYIGHIEGQKEPFIGPKNPLAGPSQSKLLVSDYFGYDHWRSPNAYSSCERFAGTSAVTPGTWVSSDYWSRPKADENLSLFPLGIELHAGYTDGHVDTYLPSQVIPMKVAITPDGSAPYPSELGPGVFYIPISSLY